MTRTAAIVVSTAAILLLLLFVALPTLAAPPSTPPGQANKPERSKAPEVEVELRGRVDGATDSQGNRRHTLTSDGATWELDAGPGWFHGDEHPLEPFVGLDVTISGTAEKGSSEVDVMAVDGQAVREPGKPPWAGGWKRVGETHPGWSAEKAERMQQKFGDCFPPGQCKEKESPAPDEGE